MFHRFDPTQINSSGFLNDESHEALFDLISMRNFSLLKEYLNKYKHNINVHYKREDSLIEISETLVFKLVAQALGKHDEISIVIDCLELLIEQGSDLNKIMDRPLSKSRSCFAVLCFNCEGMPLSVYQKAVDRGALVDNSALESAFYVQAGPLCQWLMERLQSYEAAPIMLDLLDRLEYMGEYESISSFDARVSKKDGYLLDEVEDYGCDSVEELFEVKCSNIVELGLFIIRDKRASVSLDCIKVLADWWMNERPLEIYNAAFSFTKQFFDHHFLTLYASEPDAIDDIMNNCFEQNNAIGDLIDLKSLYNYSKRVYNTKQENIGQSDFYAMLTPFLNMPDLQRFHWTKGHIKFTNDMEIKRQQTMGELSLAGSQDGFFVNKQNSKQEPQQSSLGKRQEPEGGFQSSSANRVA